MNIAKIIFLSCFLYRMIPFPSFILSHWPLLQPFAFVGVGFGEWNPFNTIKFVYWGRIIIQNKKSIKGYHQDAAYFRVWNHVYVQFVQQISKDRWLTQKLDFVRYMYLLTFPGPNEDAGERVLDWSILTILWMGV